MRRAATRVSLLLLTVIGVFAAGPGPRLRAAQIDATVYLLSEEDLPSGFEHQPQNDRTVAEPGSVREVRFFTRGEPEAPTEEHASILVAATVSSSPAEATSEFARTVDTWTNLGYQLVPLDAVGDEAVTGADMLYGGTDHPKQATLLLFRRAHVNGTVQWTDDPGEVMTADALALARTMQARIDAG